MLLIIRIKKWILMMMKVINPNQVFKTMTLQKMRNLRKIKRNQVKILKMTIFTKLQSIMQ